jgi:ribosomal protein L37AE/L43A
MTSCPCCTNQMLRHLRQSQVYWFCRHCWQEMPVYSLNSYGSSPSINLVRELRIKKQLSSEAVVLRLNSIAQA